MVLTSRNSGIKPRKKPHLTETNNLTYHVNKRTVLLFKVRPQGHPLSIGGHCGDFRSHPMSSGLSVTPEKTRDRAAKGLKTVGFIETFR